MSPAVAADHAYLCALTLGDELTLSPAVNGKLSMSSKTLVYGIMACVIAYIKKEKSSTTMISSQLRLTSKSSPYLARSLPYNKLQGRLNLVLANTALDHSNIVL